MMHKKTYGQSHGYFHMQHDVMECFKMVVLRELGHGQKYMAHHRRNVKHQGVHLDLHEGIDGKALEIWHNTLSSGCDHITDLKLSFYENRRKPFLSLN